MTNHWQKINDKEWMCFNWDVEFLDGEWRVGHRTFKRYESQGYSSAEAAMSYADRQQYKINRGLIP